MYHYFKGTLALATLNCAVVECAGVGYKLTVSSNTFSKLGGKEGKEVKLYSHLAVREDALDLYGFYDEQELSAFRMLIGVSGIGPKAAMGVLSCMSWDKLAAAVVSGDAKSIAKANGVGAKGAARIVLELKDKIDTELKSEGVTPALESAIDLSSPNALSDAKNALIVLGYSASEAMYALSGADLSLPLEEIIKKALAKLASKL